MAKILFITMPITGHINPGLPIARQLVQQGHEVLWYTGKKFKQTIEATGATHFPAGEKFDFDDSDIDGSFPDRKKLKGIEQLKFDLKRIFTDHIPYSLREIQDILKTFPATVTVVDTACATGAMLTELGGPPCVAFGITALPLSSDEVAPFGLGLLPDASLGGKLRNRLLQQLATRVIFKDVLACRNGVRAELKLPPDHRGLFEDVLQGSTLYLQGTVPEFEYQRSNMPSHVRFIGPLLPDAPKDAEKPLWWNEMVNSSAPVVHISQGTIATSTDDLIVPAIFALADMDVLVVVSSKTLHPSTQAHLPANVRVADFLPYSELMKHVDVFVTNGGYGGVHYALAHAVPIVVGGTTEDKPEVANRIEWSGAGINLRTSTPDTSAIRRAVKKVLRHSCYKQAAQRLSASIQKHDAVRESAQLIEAIAAGAK